MEELYNVVPPDSQIKKIVLSATSLEITIMKWDNELFKLVFADSFRCCDKNSIDQPIGNLIISQQSLLIDEITKEIIDGGGTKEEILNIYYVAFLDAWEGKVLLELVAGKVEIIKDIETIQEN